MQTQRVMMMLAAALLVVAGCGDISTGDPTTVPGATGTTSSAPDTTTTAAATTAASLVPTTEPEDPTSYLVDMSNLVADYLDQAASFGSDYTAQNARPVTEQEQIDFIAGYLNGLAVLALEHAMAVEAVAPPSLFANAHRRYIDTLRLFYEEWQRTVSGFTTLVELEAFWASASDPIRGLSNPLGDLQLDAIAACNELEDTAAEAGYDLDIRCAEGPSQAFEVSVEVGATWIATPSQLPPGTDVVAIRITNTSPEPIRPVVLDIFEGDPLNLPVGEGLVDLSLGGVIDPSSGYAAFGLAYPEGLLGDDGRVLGEPPELPPGESMTVRLWISGDIVIFDYRDSAYEAGSYVAVERP